MFNWLKKLFSKPLVLTEDMIVGEPKPERKQNLRSIRKTNTSTRKANAKAGKKPGRQPKKTTKE